MKTNRILALALLGLATLNAQLSTLFAQGTAFTYQGRLNHGTSPANGVYDLRFAAFQNPTAGGAVLGPITNSAVSVTNGLFTTLLDFGPYDSAAYGRGRWLEISARTNGSAPWTVLSPRQPMTPAPSAIYAAYAGGPAPGEALNATHLGGLDSSSFWHIGGNGGTTPGTHFLGTTDNQPLELRAANQPILRLAYATSSFYISPNIVGGFSENMVTPGFVGGFIAAGGLPSTGISSSLPNLVQNHFGSIGGGYGNRIEGFASAVGGGRFHLCGGIDSVIGGGFGNTNSGGFATVGGGLYNTVNGRWGTVPGGANNTVSGWYCFAAGRRAKSVHDGAFVWADSQDADFRSTGLDQFLVRASGGVGINTTNPGAMLQVGDANWAGSQGMIRLGTRSAIGAEARHWDIGVPRGDADTSGKFYSFVIDDVRLGTEPEVVVRWDTGNVGIGTTAPASRLHAVASNGNGVQGNSSGFFSSGVYGENLSGAGYGVAGRATGTGNGVFGENPNVAGWAGNFVGNVRVTGTINPPSDRNVKRDFATVDARAVLEKVAALSIRTWAYTNDSRGTRHLGPVAQDFRAAFALGVDDKSIATVDADGVALAAIQGLNQKLTEELKRRDAENAELRNEILEIKQLLTKLTTKGN